jgi:ABC-type sugar transport system substrate-binding protein
MKRNRIHFRLCVFLLVIPVLLTLPGLAGCGRRPQARFALCMSHLSNSFTNTLRAAARARASELGVNLVILDAQQDLGRQESQIATLLHDGITGLMIEPVAAAGLEKVLAQCRRQKVPVVLVTQRVADASLYDCYVGTDAVVSGRLEMTACVRAWQSGDPARTQWRPGGKCPQSGLSGCSERLSGCPDRSGTERRLE